MAKILIVDDSSIMRITLKQILESLSHDVVSEATNGKNAIKQYEKYLPDLVTMDISMPMPDLDAYDGIKAVEEIKKINPQAKIIMITSHGDQEKVLKAIEKGASSYILKPLNKQRLKDVVDKVLAKP